MQSPFQPEGEKLLGGETEQDTRRLSEWMAQSACGGGAAGWERGACEPRRVSRGPGDAPDRRSARVGVTRIKRSWCQRLRKGWRDFVATGIYQNHWQERR